MVRSGAFTDLFPSLPILCVPESISIRLLVRKQFAADRKSQRIDSVDPIHVFNSHKNIVDFKTHRRISRNAGLGAKRCGTRTSAESFGLGRQNNFGKTDTHIRVRG